MKLSRGKMDVILARNGMNYTNLADKTGVTKSAICRSLKSEKIRTQTAGKIAQALGCDVTEILEEGR